MSVLESIKNIFNIPDEDEFEDNIDELEERPQKKQNSDDEVSSYKRNDNTPRLIKSKAVNYNQNQLQVVLVKPDRFEDVTAIADHLNEKKTVVLNLEAANRDVSRRIIDFLSGVAYANHGNIRKVANSTFIIVARDVDVMGELMLDDYDESKLYF
ncbi:MAG: cell division protein SepF [Clostridia bacterium]|nr:cell division protein SepF [Clostridia bacterium]